MIKKRIITIVLALLFVFGTGAGIAAYAETEPNMELERKSDQLVEMVAGESRAMSVELRLKESWSLNPEFKFSFEEDSPLSVSNIIVKSVDESYDDVILWEETSNIVVYFNLKVDEFAKIGEYVYLMTYSDILMEAEDSNVPDPGYLMMKVSVIDEMVPPQVSVVSGAEFSCNAGETVKMSLVLENQGELEALNTYVYMDYTVYDDILLPAYTPLKQKIGSLKAGDRQTVELTYRVDEETKTQRMKLPVVFTYKMATGEEFTSTAYVYLKVMGKPEPTATPTPVPTATPTPEVAELLVHTVKQYPENPRGGENLQVEFYLQNIGTAPVKNLKLSLEGMSTGGFEPVSQDPYQYIGVIEAGQSKKVTVDLKVGRDITPGQNPLNVSFNYEVVTSDGLFDGSDRVTVYILNVVAAATPTPSPIPEEAILLVHTVKQYPLNPRGGEALSVEFYLENIGTAPVRNLKLSLEGLSSGGFEPVSPEPYQYIGVIEEGKSKKVKLNLKVGVDIAPGQNPLNISYSYDVVTSNGTTSGSDSVTVYILNVSAAATATPTPSPTPTATPTPTPTPIPQTSLLLLNTVKQSPSQPKAGETLKISFYLENAGNVTVKNVKVLTGGLASNGFEPVTSEPYHYIGEIAAGKKQKVELTLKVGENISEGLNVLNVQYFYDVDSSYGSTTETEQVTLYILDVQNPEEEAVSISRPKLMVSDFYTDVEEVKAGSVFDFTFEILNTNDSIAAKNIKVTVNGAANAFSVTAGGNSFFVSEINPQERAPITINLKASAAATTGAYPIQIKIEYEYEGMIASEIYGGEVVEEEILLQVKENLRPSVENVYIGSWDTPMVQQPTTMSFEFYNMGKSTLNNTYVTVEGDFMLSNGSNTFYIGNIAAGMPEYIEFDIVPLIEGDAVGKMIIHMEDSNGDEVTMEKEFSAYVMGEMSWEDPGYIDPGYMDPGYMDPSVPVDGDAAEKPILPPWLFFTIQGAILLIVIPATRAIRLAAYRRKIKREDAI